MLGVLFVYYCAIQGEGGNTRDGSKHRDGNESSSSSTVACTHIYTGANICTAELASVSFGQNLDAPRRRIYRANERRIRRNFGGRAVLSDGKRRTT